VNEDLSAAIMRCLQRAPADRWPDARSLRAAIASAADLEDPLPIRLLKCWGTMTALALIASVYLWIFGKPAAVIGTLVTMAALLIAATGTFVVAERQQFTTGSIMRLALAQPRWWRFWYPKRLRRRGDMWDRLPPRVRLLRIQSTVVFGLLMGIVLPVQLGLTATRRLPAASATLSIVMLPPGAGPAVRLSSKADGTNQVTRV